MALLKIISEKFSSCNPTFCNLPGFLNEKYSDVTVSVSYENFETKYYKLHRNVLSGCSIILQQLVEQHQTLEIPFMSPREFELLITYMYTGDVCFISVQELCTGLYAANLYRLENLLNKCSERLREKLKEDGGNALLILQSDERFKCRSDNAALFDQVDEIIRRDFGQILRSQVIQEIEKSTMKHLLQMESVSGVPEIEVFRALLRWTEAHCRKSEIGGVPKNLQEVAGDLTYQIRYNLIPIDILGSEVADSGLIQSSLIGIALQRCFNKELEVPFCTRPRVGALDQEEWQLVSACSSEQHSLQQVGRWTTDTTLSWEGEMGDSAWFPLPPAASTNTGWMVQFNRQSDDDFKVWVRCSSLDAQFRAAYVRLVAVVKGAPRVWGEVAAVLQSGQTSWWCRFCKKVSKYLKVIPIKVSVTAQWTELEHLPPTPDLWMENTARIRCSWQFRGWKVVTPTASGRWSLWSEPFGRSGALWRIVVENCRSEKRQLRVQMMLQHLPASVEWSGMNWKCSMTVWSQQFDEQQKNMERGSCCEWTAVVENVDLETRDPLDLVVVIHVNRKQ